MTVKKNQKFQQTHSATTTRPPERIAPVSDHFHQSLFCLVSSVSCLGKAAAAGSLVTSLGDVVV